MQNYTVISNVRLYGAQGYHYRHTQIIEAENPLIARDKAFQGLTRNHEVSGIDVFRDGKNVNQEVLALM